MRKSLFAQQLAQLRVLGVGLVEDDARVCAAEARPQVDLVLAQLLLVLLEHRVVQQVDVALLLVQLAGDGGQVERLRVGEELELDLVHVRQLVAGLVHADVVRVALEDEDLVADAVATATQAAMPGRSGLSKGLFLLANSSAQVLNLASATILSRSSFLA